MVPQLNQLRETTGENGTEAVSARALVLYGENDVDDAFLMKRAFIRICAPLELRVVRDGLSAVDYMEGSGRFADRISHPFPRFIVLNAKLPQLTGMQVLAWLRSKRFLADVPVLLLTTSLDPSDIERCCSAGADACVVKPFGSPDLPEMVKRLVDASVAPTARRMRERIGAIPGNSIAL